MPAFLTSFPKDISVGEISDYSSCGLWGLLGLANLSMTLQTFQASKLWDRIIATNLLHFQFPQWCGDGALLLVERWRERSLTPMAFSPRFARRRRRDFLKILDVCTVGRGSQKKSITHVTQAIYSLIWYIELLDNKRKKAQAAAVKSSCEHQRQLTCCWLIRLVSDRMAPSRMGMNPSLP